MTGHAPISRFATRHVTPPRSWRDDAACRDEDPDLFFPALSDLIQTTEAKKVCARCPVAGMCLRVALDTDQRAGMWGGLTEDERRKLRGRKKAGLLLEPDPRSWDPPKPKVQPLPVVGWRKAKALNAERRAAAGLEAAA